MTPAFGQPLQAIRLRFRLLAVFVVLFIGAQNLVSPERAFAVDSSSTPTHAQFLSKTFAAWRNLQQASAPAPVNLKPGQVGFLPLVSLVHGQDEISIDNIFTKLNERTAAGDLKANSDGSWALAHDQGRSSVPLADPIEVIKGPTGWVIADGHHDAYLAMYVGGTTIAVKVREDLSHLSPLEFWKNLKSRHLIYLQETPEQLARENPNMIHVRDNPNRYLAALIAMKVETKADGTVARLRGPANPVWLKWNDSIPFIEFHIADALLKAGLKYDPTWGASVPSDVNERARSILLKAQAAGHWPQLNQIEILPDAATATKLRANPGELTVFLNAKSCGQLFK